ncbi:large conductance mechanosensitive channel protein MscL [Cryptosporangium arvum]|jgi:large conductance mechanosensitive channel|uniref:Large-conductance mechanosensitive channel n=1 Tax=Cryptosporangium arvum DSM 44712 TaxID=927661 RepID=A0A010ZMI7_9ACTN|nr:large conductance mechanosensitive channel protein MscL [Cryptosporangium arvum]EXG79884.1 large conductance mechanosensitive channel protein [Cryptosporangium arvum DSM 44712]
MFKGFRDFIRRGNVVDLAVGVVIGAAFTGLVTQFGNSFLKPLIQLITGGEKVGGTFEINDVKFDYGAFITAMIIFVLTAAALYFVVVAPMNRLNELRRRGQEPEPAAPSEEIVLLTEIRDALRENGGGRRL